MKIKIDTVFLILQICTFGVSVCLAFGPATQLVVILQLSFSIASFLIKLIRELVKKQWKKILYCQVQFYIVYLLTAFECTFQYYVMFEVFSTQVTILAQCVIIMGIMNYSFFANDELSTSWEILFYSIGQMIHLALACNTTVGTVIQFDDDSGLDLEKDFILLVTSTIIAEGALILDFMYRSYDKIQEKKEPLVQSNEIELTNN